MAFKCVSLAQMDDKNFSLQRKEHQQSVLETARTLTDTVDALYVHRTVQIESCLRSNLRLLCPLTSVWGSFDVELWAHFFYLNLFSLLTSNVGELFKVCGECCMAPDILSCSCVWISRVVPFTGGWWPPRKINIEAWYYTRAPCKHVLSGKKKTNLWQL